MSRRVYIRATRIEGKTQDKLELIVDGYKVAELSRFDLIEFIAQATLSLKDDNA